MANKGVNMILKSSAAAAIVGLGLMFGSVAHAQNRPTGCSGGSCPTETGTVINNNPTNTVTGTNTNTVTGTNTNTVTGVNTNTVTGGNATATGGNGGTAAANNNLTIQDRLQAGVAVAPGLASGRCTNSVSLGVGFIGGALTGGVGRSDADCERRILRGQVIIAAPDAVARAAAFAGQAQDDPSLATGARQVVGTGCNTNDANAMIAAAFGGAACGAQAVVQQPQVVNQQTVTGVVKPTTSRRRLTPAGQ